MKTKIKIKRKVKKLFTSKRKDIIILFALIIGVSAIGHTAEMTYSDISTTTPQIIVQRKQPEQPIIEEVKGTVREVTMYTSRPEETDDSPCISADGTDICKVDYNVCATNAFPMNTRLNVDGLGECIVKDRMNRRYTERIDWYAGMDLQRALNFGKQKLFVGEL